jgi:hypothetical protein
MTCATFAIGLFEAGLTSEGRDRRIREAHLSRRFDALERCLTLADKVVLARKILIDFSDVLRGFERQYVERCAQAVAEETDNFSPSFHRDF